LIYRIFRYEYSDPDHDHDGRRTGCEARARFGRGHVFTPKTTSDFQYSFGWAAKAQMVGRRPFACAVTIVALFELAIPRSWSERKRAEAITGLILPTAKPDLDNFVKAAIDAINGIVVIDDAQITEIGARKIYGVSPKTIVTIGPLSGESP
jgi:Holliday junction resolvase RusA-like endonuclease